MWAAILYTCAILLANLTATLFLPVELVPGTGILVSVGTLIFGVTFTQRDRMHEKGRRFVYSVIGLSAILNLILLTSFSYMWGEWVVEAFAQRELIWLAESAAMLQASGWRIFLASFLAILLAESADTEVFEYYRNRSWFGRVVRSNAVSIPVDSLLFNLIAFAGNPFFPVHILIPIILGEIIAKSLVGILYALLLPKRVGKIN